jgi:hypothetical protein
LTSSQTFEAIPWLHRYYGWVNPRQSLSALFARQQSAAVIADLWNIALASDHDPETHWHIRV